MSTPKGTKPTQAKPEITPSAFGIDGGMGDQLALPPEVAADMEAKGWVPRWLDAKALGEHGGHHKNNWNVYRRPAGTAPSIDFKYGNDPDGIIRRGMLILGYKTKEARDQHRAFLDRKANNRTTAHKEVAADLARSLGKNAVVVDPEND